MAIFELHKEKQRRFDKPQGNAKQNIKKRPISAFADGAKYKDLQADLKLMSISCMNFKEKQKFKKGLVQKYRPHVEGMLAAGRISMVASWWAIFLMDIDDLSAMTKIIPKMIDQGQKSPADFKRTLAEVFHDKIAIWAKHEFEEKKLNPKRPFLNISLERLVNQIDTVNPTILLASLKVNAKIILAFESEDLESLRELGTHIEIMKECHHNPQIKTIIRDYEKACKKLNAKLESEKTPVEPRAFKPYEAKPFWLISLSTGFEMDAGFPTTELKNV